MSTATSVERMMLDLINAERAREGVAPLRLEQRLNDSAEDHSAWILASDTFSHAGANGSSFLARMRAAGFELQGSWAAGENLAWQSERGPDGIADDVAQLHASLMNSPGHRANILNPNFEVVGIGVERGDLKGYDGVVVTQNFARTSAPVSLDAGPESAPAPTPEPAPTPWPAPTPVPAPTPLPADGGDGGALTFEFRSQWNESRGFGLTDPDAARFSSYASVGGVIPDGDGKLMVIRGFSFDDGDVLVFRGASALGGDGRVETEADLRAAHDAGFFRGMIDADGDGGRDDALYDVDPEAGIRGTDGYDLVLIDFPAGDLLA